MKQDDIFFKSEGDKWFGRNAEALGILTSVSKDPVLWSMDHFGLKNLPSILEVGCSNGWRLHELRKRGHGSTANSLVGIDPSMAAVDHGRTQYPDIKLERGLASDLTPVKAPYACVIVSYVLHWVDRVALEASIQEIVSCVGPNGFLVISDFLPDAPVKTPYHHLPGQNVFTYKEDYARYFTLGGKFSEVFRKIYDHDRILETLELDPPGNYPSHSRGMISILKKN